MNTQWMGSTTVQQAFHGCRHPCFPVKHEDSVAVQIQDRVAAQLINLALILLAVWNRSEHNPFLMSSLLQPFLERESSAF